MSELDYLELIKNKNVLHFIDQISNRGHFEKINFPIFKWQNRYNESIDLLNNSLNNFRSLNEYNLINKIMLTEDKIKSDSIKSPIHLYCKKEDIYLLEPNNLIGLSFSSDYSNYFCDNNYFELSKNILIRDNGKYFIKENTKNIKGIDIITFISFADQILNYLFILLHSFNKSNYFSFNNIEQDAEILDNKYFNGKYIFRNIITLLLTMNFFRINKPNVYKLDYQFIHSENIYEITPIIQV